MRKTKLTAFTVVLVIGLGACGGGGDDGDDGAGTTVTTSGGTDGTLDPGDVPFLDEDCQFLVAGAYLNPLAAAVPGANADFEASADQLAAIADSAPDEIRDAMTTVAEGYAAFAEALKDVDLSDPQSFSDPAVAEKLQSVEDVFNEEYEAASQTVSDYIDANCSP